MKKVCVIGDGGWGTALALLLHKKGVDTILWSAFPEYAEFLRKKRENVKFLKGVTLPKDLEITADTELAGKVRTAVFVVPCKYLGIVAQRFRKNKFRSIISATKGIENTSLKRPSEILDEHFPKASVGVLSGPSISVEVVEDLPTTVVVASKDGCKDDAQELFTTDRFRVYTSEDVLGVELGGALKNVIAIAAGVADGMGFGTNAKAALLTRGLAEITRLGVKLGAERITFSGLSGMGDLATTCISSHSRNRWFGEQIGKGRGIEDILGDTEMVVEGLATCKSAHELALKHDVEMPIVHKVHEVIYDGKDPKQAVYELMTRDPKSEHWE